MAQDTDTGKKGFFVRLSEKGKEWWEYVNVGVWRDPRRNWKVDTIKTIALSAKSFFNADLQTQACAMTYRTLLAVVPALALLFAIGRGFGLQNVLQDELFRMFPAQRQAVGYAMNFVDSYLSTSSEGIFVGVGLVFLLWTLISLFGSIEDTFNLIWGVKQGRSFGRKITDYTAMLLILPVVMICASGLTILLSSTLQAVLDWSFLSPVISLILEATSWILTWLFFGLLYLLMPNTKVKFFNAFIAGVFAGTGFLVLQWLFVSGQLYVSKYNAIYGSFSFLPLMLLWMQLTWVITFAGGVICYSSQNIFMYSFDDAIRNMSSSYYARLTIAIGAVVVQRFVDGDGATLATAMVKRYNLPPRLVAMLCDKLVAAGILSVVDVDPKHDIKGYQPALDPSQITIADVFRRLDATGEGNFIPDFDKNFPGVVVAYSEMMEQEQKFTGGILLSQLKIKKLGH